MNRTLVKLSLGSILCALVGFACGLIGEATDTRSFVDIALILIPSGVAAHIAANVGLSFRH
ncbi:MAG: hypothetical protein HZA81_03205 [Candidatus Taylorbacteria bacterium]|nr:hypothetical protein [Candidatus Taylorbacteria bacterium]